MTLTVLVIEDDSAAARLVTLILNSEGHQVVVAPNGPQGLRMAQENPPDLILLDLMLPKQDGFQVLHRLRAEPRTAGVPVIVVSSKTQDADKETAARIGADAYLTKPYKRLELLSLIRSLLGNEPKE